jgi:selenocysteine-specific elongation factor
VRVRGVQVHGEPAESALAGQRTALNLAGASTEDLSRGMMLAPPATFVATRAVDVTLRLLPSAPHPLKNRARVHFHCYSAETVAEIELYSSKEIKPSQTAFARLSLTTPLQLLPEDRFILRQFSPVITIGGGVILDAAPIASPREIRKAEKIAGTSITAFMRLLEGLSSFERRGAILMNRITRRGKRGLSLAEAVAETGWRKDQVVAYPEALSREGLAIRIQDRLFAAFELGLAQKGLLHAIAAFHKREPLKPGMTRSELQDDMERALEMAKELFDSAISALAKENKLEVAGDLVRLPGQGVTMKEEEAESKKTIEQAFENAGLKVPALYEILNSLKIDKSRAQKIVTLLLRDKVLIKISDELVFHRTALDHLKTQIRAHKTKSPRVDVAAFKELTGVSRKYAIPLLEYLDRERVTRRVGDVREIL